LAPASRIHHAKPEMPASTSTAARTISRSIGSPS
jgi:hypothetical protein